jgi:hypothetical protein
VTTETETLTEPSQEAAPMEESEPSPRRARRIGEDDVRQAADALLLGGGRPTVERVRARLGRGSPNTIALFLDRWWRDLGARLRDLPGQELPQVPEPVAQALLALWSQAIDEARGLLKDSLGEREAQLQQRHSALEARAADLERASADLARERTALEQTVTLAQQQLAEANDRHRADQARLEALERDSARLTAQCDAARREVAEGAHRLEAARQGFEAERRGLIERLDVTERHWHRAVDEARQALAAERKRLEATERTHAAEVARVREALEAAQAERGELATALAQTREALAAARAEGEHWKAAAHSQERRADEAVKGLKQAQVSSGRQLEALERQIHDLVDRVPAPRRPRLIKP